MSSQSSHRVRSARRAHLLLAFLAFGGLLFLVVRIRAPAPTPRIDRTLRVPTLQAVASEPWIVEEILVREALALGLDDDAVVQRRLDRNLDFVEAEDTTRLGREQMRRRMRHSDPVIRRRLAQSMRFRLEAEADPTPPDELEARSFLESHPDEFAFPGFVDSEWIFFDPQRRENAEGDANDALSRLHAAGDDAVTQTGDPLPGVPHGGLTPDALAKYLGEPFATSVMSLPLGVWSGPIRSNPGFHLVRVHSREEPRPARFEEVRTAVVAAILAERRQAAYDAGVSRLRARYTIVTATERP